MFFVFTANFDPNANNIAMHIAMHIASDVVRVRKVNQWPQTSKDLHAHTMTEERMNGLLLTHIHYDMELDIDRIIDEFARQHPRRMELLDILQ